jgi:restriction endonuclease S subunit
MRKGWKRTTLGEVAIVNPKEAPLSEVSPFVPMDAVHVGKRFVAYYETRGERTGARARGGDVLFARITPCLENGKVAQLPNWVGPCGGSTEFVVIRGSKSMISDFVYFWASSERTRDTAAGLMTGTTGRQRLSWQDLSKIGLDLPPIEEQRRIVDLISSVDSYIAALQQQADAARVARNAVLSELLSAGGEDWIETTLGEVAELNPEATKNFPADQVIRYIDLASVSHETGISQDLTEVKYGHAPGRARRVVRVADVLVSTVRPYLKGFALVPKDLDGGVASTGFAVVRAKPDKTLPGFIWAFVGLEPFVLHLMDRATGSNYPAVRPEDIASFKLMLPPIAEQKRIVDLVSSMDDMIKTTHHAVSNATRMRSGLLSDLLSGDHEIPESYDRLLGAA